MQGQPFAGNQNGGFQTPNTVPGPQPVYGSQTNSYPPPGTNAPKPPSTVTIGQAHGAAGAGYFWVAPGSMAYIFDLDAPKFYVKRVDEVGRPYPLETCEYHKVIEEPPAQIDSSAFASKEEVSAIQKDVSDITETLRLMMSKIDNMNKKPQQQRKEKRNEQSV